jgi:hypothetical protein
MWWTSAPAFRAFPQAEAYAALNDATMIIVQLESAGARARRGSSRSTASTWC